MDHTLTFGLLVALVGVALSTAILSSRISDAIGVPAPALFLVAAAVASDLFPELYGLDVQHVQDIVTVALIFILFEGGMHIGWRRFRSALGPIAVVGVLGTFLTAAAVALLAHLIFDFSWLASLLIGAALAPTDPAAVFSVLGKQEISGRSGTVIEGESGANDPVGIALVASLLVVIETGATGLEAFGEGLREFLLQMAIGATVGLVLGYALRFVVRVPLPTDALYAVRTIAAAATIYGVATVAHGSGFLAVFVAGITLGNLPIPHKGEIRRVHASVASLGEIVAFAVLGLTIDLSELFSSRAWWIGLILAALLTLVVRPLLVGPLLMPVALRPGEKIFVLWSGLKGAVPILLGTFVFVAAIPDAELIYDIIFVVVLFSVVVQGGLMPLVARWCGVRMEPEP
ncbi:cation:proton antiporter [Micromonospora sp. WMMD812]|uniref:cation:proton antiporter domain-containing protein n=1 Tax=Micromonospora sp. WMMD812 TaxID=3015152 RepID=UPI00248AE79C|nr:cation:proton antiporter [Micromonospora sp. WMMD812]WBB65337.1 cation:proton antiporter [Micromonospora sp. WMMD812]